MTLSHAIQNPAVAESVYKHLLKINDCGDSPCVQKLKKNGAWKEPSPRAIKLVKSNRETINRIAREYSIDPVAIAAVIISEMSVNTQWDDRLQNTVAWAFGSLGEIAVMKVGEWAGKPISLGVAQINEFGLQDALKTIQEVEHDDVTTLSSLKANLIRYDQDLTTSITVIAALIRYAQKTYAHYGLDISQKIGVLVTLYNLGKPEERAKNTIEKNRNPTVNFLGLYALIRGPEIRSAMGLD